MEKKVLIITNHYLDSSGGGTIASLAYINAFASIFPDCTLIYPDKETNVRNLLLRSIKRIPCNDTRSRWQKGLGVYFGKIHRFEDTAKDVFLTYKPDVVVFDTIIVSYRLISLARELGMFTIILHHNVERDYFHDNPRPIYYRFAYWNYLIRAEREAVNKSDLNLTLTDSDRTRLISLYAPQNQKKFITSGVFEPFQHSPESIAPTIISSNLHNFKFAISGNLSFPQSDLSICEFINTYWPVVRSKMSVCELIITGRDPSGKLRNLCSKYSDIKLIPNPENISKIIMECDYYICPVDRGSGFKFRIMDGLQIGIPVISHEVSARGYETFARSGSVFIYNSVASFENAVNLLVKSKFDRKQIQMTYEEFFSFETGKKRVKCILEEIVPL